MAPPFAMTSASAASYPDVPGSGGALSEWRCGHRQRTGRCHHRTAAESLTGIVRVLPVTRMGERGFVAKIADAGFAGLDHQFGDHLVCDGPAERIADRGIGRQDIDAQQGRLELGTLARIERRKLRCRRPRTRPPRCCLPEAPQYPTGFAEGSYRGHAHLRWRRRHRAWPDERSREPRALSVGPRCSPFSTVCDSRFASSATAFQYRMISIIAGAKHELDFSVLLRSDGGLCKSTSLGAMFLFHDCSDWKRYANPRCSMKHRFDLPQSRLQIASASMDTFLKKDLRCENSRIYNEA